MGSDGKPDEVNGKRKSALTALKFLIKTGATSDMASNLRKRRASRFDQGPILPIVRRYTDENPECGHILKKSPLDRTNEEKKSLCGHLRNFKAFKKLSDFTLNEVCGSLNLLEYEPNRAVFKQGDVGTAWYIILSGTVSVQISKTGRIEDSIEVVKLRDG